MARRIDENKLIAIKQAAIEIVVAEGISGASVSKIAQQAEVSVGYLYRFYKGKRELLEALFEERVDSIHDLLLQQIERQSSVKDILDVFVSRMYFIAQQEPQNISFTHKLLADFSFEFPKSFKLKVSRICEQVIAIGKETKEISPDIDGETLYAIIVGGTLNFINIRLRNIFEKQSFRQEDSKKLLHLILKTLANNSQDL